MSTSVQRPATTGRTPAAEQILTTAAELFFAHGIRAVGVDTIAAESGVTKMTLYKHFGSKDGLVAAYLRTRDDEWHERWGAAVEAHRDPVARLLAAFDAYEGSLTRDNFRGCPFINAAAELPDLDHPGREVVAAHKSAISDRLAVLAEQAGVNDPGNIAEQLLLLLDGGFVTASIQQSTAPMRAAREMARCLVDSLA